MPLPVHRVLEHNRNQDIGEPSGSRSASNCSRPSMPTSWTRRIWQDGLTKYASDANLAVALAEAAGRLFG